MRQLKSFMVMNISGMNRITATYDEIDERGMPVSKNNKVSFYAIENDLIINIENMQKYISNRIEEE
ncbi:hypothetical protein [Bacteroides acidifaciens]|uniref:hypothetical protein n=1 Tax=Bacteroides acidifaciens TaxID=85831 RepID=UPI0025B0166A|nr:hypothetical protein [Bacteroides acidifaciens]